MKAVTAIKINAGNDSNGNPRRAFVVLSNGAIIEAIDEGYEGESALRAGYPHLFISAHIDVTPKEYRDMLRLHPTKGTRIKRNPRTFGVRIVHNKLLGGWYIVRGPHQTPLGGRFDSKAEAQAHLQNQQAARDSRAPTYKRAGHGINPVSTLAAHAAAINPRKPRKARKAKRTPAKLDYVELRDSAGKVYGRFNSAHTTIADIKAMARIIANQHGVAVSAHRVKR